jgi:hypothetical protein
MRPGYHFARFARSPRRSGNDSILNTFPIVAAIVRVSELFRNARGRSVNATLFLFCQAH